MERNKRKRGLDKSTRNSLSALDALILETIEDVRPPGDGEFTLDEYIGGLSSNGIQITMDSAYKRLARKVQAGGISKRKATLNGAIINVYGSAKS